MYGKTQFWYENETWFLFSKARLIGSIERYAHPCRHGKYFFGSGLLHFIKNYMLARMTGKTISNNFHGFFVEMIFSKNNLFGVAPRALQK